MKTLKFKLNNETYIPKSIWSCVPQSGPADAAIADLRTIVHVEVSLEDSQKYLRTTGTWELEELLDLDCNIDRLLWLACLDCRENKTNYWYMGE